MPQDAFTIALTASHLNNKLFNARVDRINQPTQDSVVFYLRTQNKNEKLILSANAENARVSTTSDQKEAPLQAPAFCMLLRKHLSHATIEHIEAVKYERIVKIVFNTKNEMRESGTKIIYVEIMNKYSNITLTEDGKILGAIKQSQSIEGSRPIFPGVTYKLPNPQEKVEICDKEKSILALSAFNGCDFANYIFNTFKGISKLTATEIVYEFFNKYDISIDDVKLVKIEDFYNHFYNFYETCNFNPCIIDNDDMYEFFPIDYTSIPYDKNFHQDITDVIDKYYSDKESKREFNEIKRKLLTHVKTADKKLQKKYQIALEKLLSCKNMQQDRIYGELIISNLYRITDGLEKIELENFYSSDYEKVAIKLDKNLTAKENAERYFKKYNKEKKTVASVEPQIVELENSLKYIQSLYDEIDLCSSIVDFKEITEELVQANIIKLKKANGKKREEKSTYRTYNYGGFDIFVGRNNLQNTKLTTSAERSDMWLHTKDYHSAHVIIKTEGRVVPDEVLLFAAEVCAFYSKATKSDKVPVDYTLKKFVKRPSGLPLGMVYYTDNKTILVNPNAHLDFAIIK